MPQKPFLQHTTSQKKLQDAFLLININYILQLITYIFRKMLNKYCKTNNLHGMCHFLKNQFILF